MTDYNPISIDASATHIRTNRFAWHDKKAIDWIYRKGTWFVSLGPRVYAHLCVVECGSPPPSPHLDYECARSRDAVIFPFCHPTLFVGLPRLCDCVCVRARQIRTTVPMTFHALRWWTGKMLQVASSHRGQNTYHIKDKRKASSKQCALCTYDVREHAVTDTSKRVIKCLCWII